MSLQDIDLKTLSSNIEACRICVETPMKTPLPHDPRPVVRLSGTARICIAGQAPGIRVHESGIPFNDPSGDRLRQWMGIDREQFYDQSRLAIVPMGFCFPGWDKRGGDLPPRKECRAQWHDQIFAAMPQLELILVIGRYAQDYHLQSSKGKSLTEIVKRAGDVFEQSSSPRYLPLPHPSWRNSAWLKKNPWFECEILPLLRRQVRKLMA